MELALLYAGASARVVPCEYVVQQYCTKPLSGFSTGFVVAVRLSKKSQILTGTLIGQECWKFAVTIVARNVMQSSSKSHTQNASRKILSLKHQQKLGYSNEDEKTIESTLLVYLLSSKGKIKLLKS